MNSFKLARYRAGLSVKAAAQAVGVAETAIYRWERGSHMPGAETVRALADLYGTTVDALLDLPASPNQGEVA